MPPRLTNALSGRDVEKYLERLGLDSAPGPDYDGLRTLHRAHLESIPFENLDIHLDRPIRLELEEILDKLIGQQRGGYCYELNGAFSSLLRSLGFETNLLAARVYDGDIVGIPFDHACIQVNLDQPRLVDVGFGALFTDPILMTTGIDQQDVVGKTFRLDERADGWLDLVESDVRRYRVSLQPRTLRDFEPANTYQQTSPQSHFTRNTVCSRSTGTGRITLRGLKLIETTGAGKQETDLEPGELGEALRARLGIHMSDDDVQRLARLPS